MERNRVWIRRVEVVVVALSLGLLVLMIYPALNGGGALEQTRCENNQGEIAKAIARYESAKHRFPGYRAPVLVTGNGGQRREQQMKSWIVASLQLLNVEQYDAIRKDLDIQPVELKLFQCPTAKRQGEFISYVGNCGRKDAAPVSDNLPPDWKYNGVFMSQTAPRGGGVRSEVLNANDLVDGAEYTLLISENLQAMRWTDTDEAAIGFVWFPEPNPEAPDPPSRRINVRREVVLEESNYDYARPSSWHPDGVVVAYCDGRTAFMADTIDYRVYCQLMTPNGAQAMEPGTATGTVEMYRR
jgi:hypothetical protein